jgi:hypothetical protein
MHSSFFSGSPTTGFRHPTRLAGWLSTVGMEAKRLLAHHLYTHLPRKECGRDRRPRSRESLSHIAEMQGIFEFRRISALYVNSTTG